MAAGLSRKNGENAYRRRRASPRRGQVKAAIAKALVRSVTSVASGFKSSVKKSLSRRWSNSFSY